MSIVRKFFDGFLFSLILMAIGLPISIGLVFVSNAATAAFGLIAGLAVFLLGMAAVVGALAAIFD